VDLRRGESPRELPSPPEYAGTRRSDAPEGAGASSGGSRNPMGAADLKQIRRFPDRRNTLGRGSTRHGSPSRRERKRERGPAGAKASATIRRWSTPKGGSRVLGPWPRNQDGRAEACSSARSLRPRIPQSKRPMSTAGDSTQGRRRRFPAPPSERTLGAETPRAAADPASPQGRRERNPSRG